MKKRERMYMERMQEMEKELETKNGLVCVFFLEFNTLNSEIVVRFLLK